MFVKNVCNQQGEFIKDLIIQSFFCREVLLDEKGKLKKLGTIIKLPKFARTLEIIRDDPDSFYTGELAKDIVKDIQEHGGIITLDDLKNYKVKTRIPLQANMGDYTWYTNPPPGSGAVLSLILNILKGNYRDVAISGGVGGGGGGETSIRRGRGCSLENVN